MEFYNNEDEKINLFELGKTNGVPNSQNEFGIIELGEYDCNEVSYSGLYRIYGDGQKNTPYNNGWIIGVETFKETHITQYATVTGSLETYKRKLYDGKWTNWLLVEGECKLWSGNLEKGKSVTIDRLNQFKRFKIYLSNIAWLNIEKQSSGNPTFRGVWCLNSENLSEYYIAYAFVKIENNIFTNLNCFSQNIKNYTEPKGERIQEIIGIP